MGNNCSNENITTLYLSLLFSDTKSQHKTLFLQEKKDVCYFFGHDFMRKRMLQSLNVFKINNMLVLSNKNTKQVRQQQWHHSLKSEWDTKYYRSLLSRNEERRKTRKNQEIMQRKS